MDFNKLESFCLDVFLEMKEPVKEKKCFFKGGFIHNILKPKSAMFEILYYLNHHVPKEEELTKKDVFLYHLEESLSFFEASDKVKAIAKDVVLRAYDRITAD